ncbi:MAG: class I SAM-dependent methyltransferase [Clostridia bacterium]|nr:class I SAM-dependent methyltransferase [Clostridia bacterium]
MEIKKENIDGGKAFDWGRTSADYAKYRDIYPPLFYEKIIKRGLCVNGQRALDLGTGTGVLPRNLYSFGAKWTGADISQNQITQAKRLAENENMQIDFLTAATEELHFPDGSFDVITACQCFWYFDHNVVIPNLAKMLKPQGKLLILYMAWLPYEDKIAGESERLVLKYNPNWTGAGETKKAISIPDIAFDYFDLIDREEYYLNVGFTKESWNGRMKACRGIGASLSASELTAWEQEHKALLDNIAPEEFDVRHYAALAVLQKRK